MTTFSRSLRTRVPLIAGLAALALALFAPQALAGYVYTGNYDDDTVSVIDPATNQLVGEPIPVGDGPYSMAITPDGKTLLVANTTSEDVTVVDLQTKQVVTSIPLGFRAATVAITPDGKTAWVTAQSEDAAVALDLQTNQASTPFPVGGVPWGVAFTPDGKSAWVTNESADTVSVLDVATKAIVATVYVGEDPINVVFTPDGKTAYVNNYISNNISVIDTATRQVLGSPIPTGEGPWGLGLTPDASKLYVSNYSDDTVSVIDTATRQVIGNPIPTGDEPYELAATPNGKAVYVANYSGDFEDRGVTVIDTQTNQAADIDVSGGPWQVAIGPDQSPTASFTAQASAKNPLSVAFSAINASDPEGSVVGFNWSFGDGATAANGGATTTHKYAKAGSYTVSLTAFDSEGCSGFVFTGRTAFCNGPGPVSQTLSVKAPNNFKFGKLIRNKKKGTAKLKVKVPYAGKLTLTGKKVKKAKRSAKKAGTVTLNIRPKPKAKKELAAKGSAKVRIKVTFKPTGGKAKSKGRTVKLIKK